MSRLHYIMCSLTRTRASVRLVHTAISSRVLMSGYRFLWKVASSSCSCWLVKWVLCRLCFFFLDSSAFPSSLLCSTDLSFSGENNFEVISGAQSHLFLRFGRSRTQNGSRAKGNHVMIRLHTARQSTNMQTCLIKMCLEFAQSTATLRSYRPVQWKRTFAHVLKSGLVHCCL